MGEWLLPQAHLLHPNSGGGDLHPHVGVPTTGKTTRPAQKELKDFLISLGSVLPYL